MKDCNFCYEKERFPEIKKENEQLKQKLDWFLTETVAGKEYRPKEELEELQRENEQLKQQIEKMKNCSNCNGIIKGGVRTERCKICIKDTTFGYWELAE